MNACAEFGFHHFGIGTSFRQLRRELVNCIRSFRDKVVHLSAFSAATNLGRSFRAIATSPYSSKSMPWWIASEFRSFAPRGKLTGAQCEIVARLAGSV